MRRRLPAVLAALGAALVVAGVIVFAVANRAGTPLEVGWSAYTPLPAEVAYRSDATVVLGDRWSVLWTGAHLLGAGLVVLGLLVLTAVGGWVLGRRAGSRR